MKDDQEGKPRRRRTRTSAFGTSGRISHDSSKFYNARMYGAMERGQEASDGESEVGADLLDMILCKTSERMDELPDRSVHLMVTSPPYNVGKEYDEDLSLDEYRAFLGAVWAEVYRVLVPGGRACVNIANLGRRPYIPLHAYLIEDLQDLGFLMRGEVIWNKAASASPSTAWGSWCSASNPTLRDTHEYILIFSKETFTRRCPAGRRSTISRDQFLEYTRSVWTFPAEPARRVGHPAPFPVELPHRLIQLYTYQGETVLDPFAGSGATCLAALQAGRRYVGYEINPQYVALAEQRIGRARAAQVSVSL